jgi:hypothetical protein
VAFRTESPLPKNARRKVHVAQPEEQRISNPQVAGSSPAVDANLINNLPDWPATRNRQSQRRVSNQPRSALVHVNAWEGMMSDFVVVLVALGLAIGTLILMARRRRKRSTSRYEWTRDGYPWGPL